MDTDTRADVLKRLAYIEGHLRGVRKMIEEDQYCVDVLKQTYAIRRAIEKMEAIILEGHLHTCVIERKLFADVLPKFGESLINLLHSGNCFCPFFDEHLAPFDDKFSRFLEHRN